MLRAETLNRGRYVGETTPAGNAETLFRQDFGMFPSEAGSVHKAFIAAERSLSRSLDEAAKALLLG